MKPANTLIPPGTNAVMLSWDGPGPKRVSVRGPVTGSAYRFKRGAPQYVDAADAEVLLQRLRKGGKSDFILHTEDVATTVPAQPTKRTPSDSPQQPIHRPTLPKMTGDILKYDDVGKSVAEEHLKLSIPKMKKEIEAGSYSATEIQDMVYTETEGQNRKGMIELLTETLDRVLDTSEAD